MKGKGEEKRRMEEQDTALSLGESVVLSLYDNGSASIGMGMDRCLTTTTSGAALLSADELGEALELVDIVTGKAPDNGSTTPVHLRSFVALKASDGRFLCYKALGMPLLFMSSKDLRSTGASRSFMLQGISSTSQAELSCGKPFTLVPQLPLADFDPSVCILGGDDPDRKDLTLNCAVDGDEGVRKVWFTAERVMNFQFDEGEEDESQQAIEVEITDNTMSEASSLSTASPTRYKEDLSGASVDVEVDNVMAGVDALQEGLEKEFMCGAGPLGLMLNRTQSGRVLLGVIDANGQCANLGLSEGDQLCSVGSLRFADISLDSEGFNRVLSVIRQDPRPLRLTVRTAIPSAAPAGSPTPSDISSGSSDEESMGGSIRGRKELAAHREAFERESLLKLLAGYAFVPPSLRDELNKEPAKTLVRRGPVKLKKKMALWNTFKAVELILLSDTLLIATPPATASRSPLPTIDTVLPLTTVKLRMPPPTSNLTAGEGASFELVTPSFTSAVVLETVAERDQWVQALSQTITSLLALPTPSGMHRVVLGTLHSAAISGDTSEVSALLSSPLAPGILESKDSAGFTAADCAVYAGQGATLSLLVAAGASLGGTMGGRGLIHVAAEMLSSSVVSQLLAACPAPRVLAEMKDGEGYTALQLAVDAASGAADTAALRVCLSLLCNAGADVSCIGPDGLTPIQSAALDLKFWAVEALAAEGASTTKCGTSSPPLHLACSVGPNSGGGEDGSGIGEWGGCVSDLPLTIEVLLKWGAPPNSKDSEGRTPLELLLNTGNKQLTRKDSKDVTLSISKSPNGASTSDAMTAATAAAVSLLIRHGARMTPEIEAAVSALPGGSSAAQESISAFKSAPNLTISPASGGNGADIKTWPEGSWADTNEPECALCGVTFNLFRRIHHCRFCGRPACGACSTKTVIVEKQAGGSGEASLPHRCCDPCYHVLQERQRKDLECDMTSKLSVTPPVRLTNFNRQSSSSLALDGASTTKAELFSGATATNTNSTGSEKGQSNTAAASGVNAALNQIGLALAQRGAQLDSLGDKSEALKDSASQFADMAKALRQQNERQSSWWG